MKYPTVRQTQCSIETSWRMSGSVNYQLITNSLVSQLVKGFWKSLSIWQSYVQNIFGHGVGWHVSETLQYRQRNYSTRAEHPLARYLARPMASCARFLDGWYWLLYTTVDDIECPLNNYRSVRHFFVWRRPKCQVTKHEDSLIPVRLAVQYVHFATQILVNFLRTCQTHVEYRRLFLDGATEHIRNYCGKADERVDRGSQWADGKRPDRSR